ncbi:DNA-binding transcriptional regulator, ArsR family [Clostridium sp. DSM 8431]|uniref:ArsR/SmtB family transcription factor n=1 Tax=Clostridium sp. DSM 8431 TaxID=1761781 RepID=UPI0008EF60F8|nr:ArsR family transcriptional regulator [Clostridium sp. DSM 8431]SFU61011.1 DNA-binding transcriptional regulator, ArsR family [Clostridium sp. DSM 8431]
MDKIKIFKALGNKNRLNILLWLKDPKDKFDVQHLSDADDFKGGVCVSSIKKASGLSQSTISEFLSIMQEAELVESKCIGQYTYFRRNEETIKKLAKWIEMEL